MTIIWFNFTYYNKVFVGCSPQLWMKPSPHVGHGQTTIFVTTSTYSTTSNSIYIVMRKYIKNIRSRPNVNYPKSKWTQLLKLNSSMILLKSRWIEIRLRLWRVIVFCLNLSNSRIINQWSCSLRNHRWSYLKISRITKEGKPRYSWWINKITKWGQQSDRNRIRK